LNRRKTKKIFSPPIDGGIPVEIYSNPSCTNTTKRGGKYDFKKVLGEKKKES